VPSPDEDAPSSDNVEDRWETAITVVDMNSRDSKMDLLEFYANATLTAIASDDSTWASILSEQVTEQMDNTNDTTLRNRFRKLSDQLTGTS
jgi:hypothetical protein